MRVSGWVSSVLILSTERFVSLAPGPENLPRILYCCLDCLRRPNAFI